MIRIAFNLLILISPFFLKGQPCTAAAGNQATYGFNNQWIGYVYNNEDFTNYHGFVKKGSAASPNFTENFGGDYIFYPTSGCPIYTETFSVRYKLQQNFADDDYDMAVGGDDGFRLSVDGGATWLIDSFTEHNFLVKHARVHLNGTTKMVLEYFEHEIINRLSFEMHAVCKATGNQELYGTDNRWIGYVYDNMNFTAYKGKITVGTVSDGSFQEAFGQAEGFSYTDQCVYYTDSFSVRFKLKKYFASGYYTFRVGGDDGYRLSLDGGATWPLTNFGNHSYLTSEYSVKLKGDYNMVLEYFDKDGDNIVSYEQLPPLLAIGLQTFSATRFAEQQNELQWKLAGANDVAVLETERSKDGYNFEKMADVVVINNATNLYRYLDRQPFNNTTFYRLKLIYRDRTISYSQIVKVSNKVNKLLLFPNPVLNHSVRIIVPVNSLHVVLTLFDYTGRRIKTLHVSNVVQGQQLILDLPASLSRGNYILSYQSDTEKSTKQMLTIL